jgi:heme exporter protein D
MNWSSFAEFAAMGGYSFYVWGAFGVTAVVMLGELASLRARRRALASSVMSVDEELHDRIDYREGAA